MPTQSSMRVYYFTPPSYALENLERRHLKISRFSKCNDPFKLASFSQKNKKIRLKFGGWISSMDKSYGLLCFCQSWKNPVMWAHYAENHLGLCYGFDVDIENLIKVRYVKQRIHPNATEDSILSLIEKEGVENLIATKFEHWCYEEEYRMLMKLPSENCEKKHFFEGFSESLKLREVIVGCKSEIAVRDVQRLVDNESVEVFKSRPAFRKFEICRQLNKAIW